MLHLPLSNRILHILERNRIHNIRDLLDCYVTDKLGALKGIGPKSLSEIKIVIDGLGYTDIHQGSQTAKPIWDSYNILAGRVKEEIKSKRLTEKVFCKGIYLAKCFPENLDKIPIDFIVDYIKSLDCAIKHKTIDQEMSSLLSSLDEREINILINRYGSKRHTLQDLATIYGITRERIRQISRSTEKKVLSEFYMNCFPRLQTALLHASSYRNRFSYKKWGKRLSDLGLIDRFTIKIDQSTNKRIDILHLIVSVVFLLKGGPAENYLFLPDQFFEYMRKPKYSAHTLNIWKNLSKTDKSKINKIVRNSGAICVSNPIGDAYPNNVFKEILELLGFEEISKGWYSKKVVKKNNNFNRHESVMNNALKILKVSDNIKINDLREGINNAVSRLGYSVVPVNVLGQTLKLNGFTIVDSHIKWPANNTTELEGRDKILVNLVEKLSPVVTFQEICDAFEIEGLSRASAIAAMQYSPIITKN